MLSEPPPRIFAKFVRTTDSVQRTRHSLPVNTYEDKNSCNRFKKDFPSPWRSRKSPFFQILLWAFKFELVESVIGHSGVAMGMTNVGLVVVHLCAIDIRE